MAGLKKPPPLSEADFLQQVIELAKLRNWRIFHARPARTEKGWRTAYAGDDGFPDLVMVRPSDTPDKPSRLIFAELKSARGKLTEDQWAWQKDLFNTSIEGAYGCGESTRCEGVRFEVNIWRPSNWEEIVQDLE